MSALANNTLASPGTSFYAPAGESAKNWYQFPALNGTVLLADMAGIQTLQAIGNDLFYNGELLAKAGDIQDIAAWSDYPAINNVNMDGFSLQDVSGLTVNNGATMGTLLVSNGITSQANIITPTLQIAGAAIPSLGQITTATLAASGLIQAGSISSTGAISGTAVSGTSLATTGGLDMANTAITRASTVGISNAGVAPYGALSSPDGVMLTWNGANITTGGAGNASLWANYPAVTNVNMGTNNITNAYSVNATLVEAANVGVGVTGSGKFLTLNNNSITSSTTDGLTINVPNSNLAVAVPAGNMTTTVYSSMTDNVGSTYNLTVDRGANPASSAAVNIVAQNGGGGAINLTASPALLTPVPGKVLITANGGQVILPTDPPTTVTVGGLIELDANTGTPGGVYTATSAIKMNAAGINSYAGAIPSVGSLAGYNFIYGSAGVSLCAGLPSSGFQLPGTTYLYGIGSAGFTGVRLQSPNGIGMLSDTYATNLYPLDGDGLIIQGRSLPDGYVTIKDVTSFTMRSGGSFKTDTINSLSSVGIFYLDNLIASTNQGIQTNFLKPPGATAPGTPSLLISGNAFGGNQNYVNLANVGTLSFDTTGTGAITNVQSINGAVWPPPTGDASLWSQYPATSIIDVSGYDISGVITINGTPYPPVVSSADWSLYPAIHTVDMSNQEIINANNIGFLDNGTIISAGQLSIFADTALGNINIATNGGGDVNIGTGNAGDIKILTTGAGNDLILGGDTVQISAGVSINANSTLSMEGHDIIGVANITGSVGGTVTVNSTNTLVAEATNDVTVTSDSGSVTLNGQIDTSLTATTGAVNLTGATEIRMTAPNIYGVGAYTGTSVSATGDVISSSATTPYSLNAIGGLVNGNQQYNYWVAVNGSDSTGTGSVLRPFASVTAALAATVSISDTIPINICLTAGTYTENPTMTRNNTFIQGSVGIADCVIVGTFTFNSSSSSTVSQGLTGVTVVGNVVCSESTSSDTSWYIQNCNITSYGTVALAGTSTGAGNNGIILYNTVVTQNVTANAAITINSVRLNAIQSQINNTTTGSSVACSGTGSMSLFGVTMTCAGSATASPIIAFTNITVNGTASSFTLCTFTYTQSTAGSGKTAVFFNNSAALAGLTVFNQNVFNMLGSTSLILRPGAGSVAIQWGTNSSNILTLPAAGTGLTYTYLPSTPLRANTLYDSTSSAGTGSQVLTAGSAGGSLAWSSLGSSSLGALAATTAARANLNSLVMYDTSNNALTYDSPAYSCVIQAVGTTAALTQVMRGRTYIGTGGAGTITFSATGFTAADAGFFVKLKNGNAQGGGDITIAGATGNTVVHNLTATASGGVGYIYWNGTALIAY